MINKVILVGNLGRDPEVRSLDNGAKVAKFSVATNESYKDQAGEWQTVTEWHDVVVWRALADRAETTLKKGSMVYVEGKLTHRKYQDKDGNDRYVTEVVGRVMRSLERRSDGPARTNFPTQENEPNIGNASTATSSQDDADDLPF